MTLNEFITKYNGKVKGFPTDNDYPGECLSIVKLWMQEKYGFYPPASGTNSAYGYWSNFPEPLPQYYDKVENTQELVPKENWICIWNTNVGNGYGHIDIVTKKTIPTTSAFTGFDQNWNGKEAHYEGHDYTNVEGFLVPKENMPDTIAVPKQDFENLVNKSTKWDKAVNELQLGDPLQASFEQLQSVVGGYKSRITVLSDQLGKAQAEVINREEQVGRLKEQLLVCQGEQDRLADQLKSKQEEVDKMAQAKGQLAIELQQLQNQYDTLKQQVGNGEYTITVGEFFKLLWNQKITIKRG